MVTTPGSSPGRASKQREAGILEFIIVAAVIIAAIWGIAFVVLVIPAILSSRGNGDKIAKAEASLKAKYGEGDYAYSIYGPSYIGVSFEKELIAIGSSLEAIQTYPFSAVRDCRIEVDDQVVTTTTGRTSTGNGGRLAGAAAGAALLGLAGLLLASVTGGHQKNRSRSVETRLIRTVKIIVRVSDHNAPLHTAFFLKLHGKGYPADSEGLMGPVMARAMKFYALLSNVVENNQRASANY